MRSTITTALELAGLLALVAAAFVALLPTSLPLALAAGGALLLVASAAVEWAGRR